MGYHGRDCILQALCESPQIFNKKQRTMVQELIKTVFSFPKSKVLPFEHPELLIYDEAHRKGRNKVDCYRSYPKCGFSLVMLALGKYSEPPKSWGEGRNNVDYLIKLIWTEVYFECQTLISENLNEAFASQQALSLAEFKLSSLPSAEKFCLLSWLSGCQCTCLCISFFSTPYTHQLPIVWFSSSPQFTLSQRT